MKKIIAAAAIIIVIGGFIFFQQMHMNSESALTPTSSPSNSPITAGTFHYKDGTYTGAIGSASQYGDIQVKVIITGGKIADILYVQFPTGGGHTNEVTAMAEPTLKQEVIAAQSATINVVSGATQDTQGFIQSLQSALDQAKI